MTPPAPGASGVAPSRADAPGGPADPRPLSIWCAISGHGFGHMAQVIPVLRAIATRRPNLRLHIAGQLPGPLLARRLGLPHTLDPTPQDVGLVQPDPMEPDLSATRAALARMFSRGEEAIAAQAEAMTRWGADLLLADIPCLPLAAAARAGVPGVALASLSWDHILAAYFDCTQEPFRGWLRRMEGHYRQATLALLPEPALPPRAFPHTRAIPPIARPGAPRRAPLRQLLGIPPGDDRPLALVTLGGVPPKALPVAALARQDGCHWLLDRAGPLPADAPHLHDLAPITRRWPFADVLASVEAVVGKPGYGLSVDCVAADKPFLFARRGHFPDEPVIIQWLNRHARCHELPQEQLLAGHWWGPLQRLLSMPSPPRPRLDGAQQAAQAILAL